MSRKMLINARHADELRVAIIDNGVLDSYQVETAESGLTRGNVYRGVVARIEPSLNAAFIDYGAERHGFLPGDDVLSQAYHKKPEGKGRHPRIETILERGKPVLVQVVKEAIGQKGAALTTNLSFAGRYLVLTPFDGTRGISRKVDDETARKKLKALMSKIDAPEGFGVIARTNAVEQNKTTLSRDLSALQRLFRRVQGETKNGKGPRLLYSDQDLVLHALRDYLDGTVEEVLVDDDRVHQKAEEYMRAFMPRAKTRLERYQGRLPLFTRYRLEQQIDHIFSRSVSLPSGGSIVIDGTEALTAVDVNSGKGTGGGHEETVLTTNMEAAREVARQLRLRDIGGLVVVDFIDFRHRRNERKVEKELRDALKADKARTTISRISSNGLLEINRQRLKQALQVRTHRACPTCNGSGTIASSEFVALALLRRIEARAAAGDLRAVKVELHPELADSFQNTRRQDLAKQEREYSIRIEIIAAADLHRSEERVQWMRREPGKDPVPARPAAFTASDMVAWDAKSRKGAPPEPEPAVETGAEGEGGEKRKRRRRRRRRKKGGGEAQAAEAAAQAPQAAQAVEGEAKAGAAADAGDFPDFDDDDSQLTLLAKAEQEASGEGPRRKRRRRRRRRGGGGAKTEAQSAAAAKPAGPADTTIPEGGVVLESISERQYKLDRELRFRELPAPEREPRPRGDSEQEARPPIFLPTAESPMGEAEARGSAGAAEDGSEERKPRRRRSRRRGGSKETAEASAAEAPASEAAAVSEAAPPPMSDETADEKPARQTAEKPVRRRRTRKKADEPADEAVAEEAAAPRRTRRKKADEASAEAAEAPVAEEKPKRRRRTTKKTAAASESSAESAADAAPVEEEKPKRRRRTTKKAAEAADEAEEKPKRRRRTTKKAAESAETAEATPAAAEEKPKRRRTTKKKAAESTDAAEGEEKPKKRRTRKKAEPADAEGEEKPKPRTRRTRKKAEPAAEAAAEG